MDDYDDTQETSPDDVIAVLVEVLSDLELSTTLLVQAFDNDEPELFVAALGEVREALRISGQLLEPARTAVDLNQAKHLH
ncbi:hypothetical protein [Xanthomonas phage pXoo2107]|nr:hypothetical protein [Xanthomonas phage pXoo2107]